MWKCESQAPGGGDTRGRFGCGDRPGNARRFVGGVHHPSLILASFTTRLHSCIWPSI